jgi:hypothetical protein
MHADLSISSKPALAGSLAALGSVLPWSGWFTRHGVTTDISLTPALTAITAAATLGEWPDGVTIAAVLIVEAGGALASGAISGISFKRRVLPQQT